MATALVKKPFATRLDEQIMEALSAAADQKGVSIAKYLEKLLINDLKTAGTLADDFKPPKTNWGGKRQAKDKVSLGAGKPRRSPNDPADVEKHSSKDGGGSSESRSPNDADAIGGEVEGDR